MNAMRKSIIIAILSGTSVVNASEATSGMTSAYSFGGACASQGVWTQEALSATQNLRKVTLQLKDDPNCQALGKSTLSALDEIQSQIKVAADSPQRSTRLSQIPAEIEALRTFGSSTTDMRAQVMQMMMNRSIEGATLSAQVGADISSTGINATGSRMADFGERIQRSANTGISLLTKVIDSIPALDQCLVGEDQQAIGNFIAASVQVATAFAGSGQDSTGSKMATLVSKLTNVTREKKFSKVLRKLNQQEFLSSMSCLMEVTSESYCQARDAMSLFKDGMSDIEWRQSNIDKVDPKNPFVGYYVLNTHVPNITKWMQKIQIGVDPKLPTDADFQNTIQQEVVDFYKGLKTLLGNYNATLITIQQLPTLEAKQNAVVKLVKTISDAMIQTVPGKTNFFTMNKTALKIPFFLIGMDDVPDQVAGKATGLMPISSDQWLQAHYGELKQFQDPIALAETIGRNMQELAVQANISVISYFSNWFIVDKQALVGEALTNVNYTVKDSLRAIHQYLDIVRSRIARHGDASIISTIMDTQQRISNILAAFDKVENIGKKFNAKKGKPSLSTAEISEAALASEELIKTVFSEFMVMQARSGFLANRLVNFVYQDYIQLLKSGEKFTDQQKEIFIQAGMAALDRMLQMYNGNPALIQSDLNMALRINKGNIEALEDLLKDNVIATIANLKMVSEGKARKGSTFADSLQRLVRDSLREHPLGMVPPSQVVTMAKHWWKHSDRYPLRSSGTASPQSEFNEAYYLQAQMCVQALAFNDQKSINDVCKNTVLKSPFKNVKGYDIAYSSKLTQHLNDTSVAPVTRTALNHSSRICAFRDFNRKNMVLFMSLNKNNK